MESINAQQLQIETILKEACAQLSDERLSACLSRRGDYKPKTLEALRAGTYGTLTLGDFLTILRATDRLKDLVQPITVEHVKVDADPAALYLKLFKERPAGRKTAIMNTLETAGIMSRAKFYQIKTFEDFRAFMTLEKIDQLKNLVDANVL